MFERYSVSCVSAPRRGGFSLIELLVVIALIGLLAGLLIPAVGSVRQQAQMTSAGHNMRQVLIAWSAEQRYASGDLDEAESVHAWALVLARRQGLNDARLYRVTGDPRQRSSGNSLLRVGQPQEDGSWQLSDDFVREPTSVVIASGVVPGIHPPSTPVMWTRGLRPEGRWASLSEDEPAVFGDRGGFIGFLDGRVEFFEDLTLNGGLLTEFGTGLPTADIRRALPPAAVILRESSPAEILSNL
ncbi:MAG: prepilin-type N-terminal cleavage/methylation domain-containing protein [Opitutales bacterium]|nr:prepilin-type N-terminal cleavage/methylation domain-containing protein [Opitutales bacterium]